MKKKMSKKSIRKFNCVCPDGRDYILQLDYQEDLEDYIDNLKISGMFQKQS